MHTIYDKEKVLELVKQDGMNLRYANSDLQEDKEIVFEAIKNNISSLPFASEKLQKDEELLSYVQDEIKKLPNPDSYYFHMLDPKSGYRYDIPMLTTMDPVYYFKYVSCMKMKEQSPDTFEKMLRWD